MPTKPKYDYDIDEIAHLESDEDTPNGIRWGISLRAIARKLGWPEIPMQRWKRRNFLRKVRYVPRNKGEK